MLKRQVISKKEFDAILEKGKIVRRDRRHGVKVAIDEANQAVIKTFDLSRKSWLRKLPYFSVGGFFIRNAEHLKRKGIRTISPQVWFWCPEINYELTVYPMLPGRDVYARIRLGPNRAMLEHFARYVAKLHAKGVYFRAGHPENYLLQEDNEFAVIDIDNLRFSMNVRQRAKNLFYIVEHASRKCPECFSDYRFSEFLDIYFSSAKLGSFRRWLVLLWFKRYNKERNVSIS